MAPHSSVLAWKIPWMEEPGRLQSMGSLRVGHDWATSLSLFTFMHWRRKWQPTPAFQSPRDGGACWAAVYGVAQSRTRLKQLSSSSSSIVYFWRWISRTDQCKSYSLCCRHFFFCLVLLNKNYSSKCSATCLTQIACWNFFVLLLLLLLLSRFSRVRLCATP